MRYSSDENMTSFSIKKCGEDPHCHQEEYHLYLTRKCSNVALHPSIELYFRPPLGVNMKYTHSSKLELVEYLCFVAGILSLWMGISGLIAFESLFTGVQFLFFKFLINNYHATLNITKHTARANVMLKPRIIFESDRLDYDFYEIGTTTLLKHHN